MPTPDDSVGAVERQLREGSWVPTPTPRQVLVASVRVRNRIAGAIATGAAESNRIA
jgi:hypothetical protein